MTGALLGARLVLACALVVAGVAKLVDLGGARRSLEQFGVAGSLAGPASVGLSLAEIAVAVGLVPRVTAWPAALGASALLAVFTVAIARAVAQGVEADCHCFGQLSSRPVGAGTLARNGLLFALALFVVVAESNDAGTSATAWTRALSAAEAAALITCAVLALVTVANVLLPVAVPPERAAPGRGR